METLMFVIAINIILVNLTEAKDNGKRKRADETMKNELNATKGNNFLR